MKLINNAMKPTPKAILIALTSVFLFCLIAPWLFPIFSWALSGYTNWVWDITTKWGIR